MLTLGFRRTALVSVATGAVVSGMALTGVPVSAASHHASLPGKTHTAASLVAVAVAPHSTTAFALGTESSTTSTKTYALRRTGSHWSKLKVKGATGGEVTAIAAGSPKSAWLVGSIFSGGEAGLILHSKGGSFTKQKAPAGSGALTAVAASSAKDAWAVGNQVGGPLVIHWNGHKWSTFKLPKSTSGDGFTAVAMAGKSVWLLGNGTTGPIVAHGTGHKFSIHAVKVPTGASLDAIAASSAHSAWLAGSAAAGTAGKAHTLVLHGNGKKWTKVKTPSPYQYNGLHTIAAAGKHAYAAGTGTKLSSPKGLDQHAFVIAITGKHGKSEHVSVPGKSSGAAQIAASSKAAVVVGTSYNGYICGAHSANVFASPFAAALHGSSWGHQSTPRLRRAGDLSDSMDAAPAIPAC